MHALHTGGSEISRRVEVRGSGGRSVRWTLEEGRRVTRVPAAQGAPELARDRKSSRRLTLFKILQIAIVLFGDTV